MKLEVILKSIADETRLRILNILKDNILCCKEIQYILKDVKQSNLSRHMTKLNNAGLILSEKKAQWINYYINKNLFDEYSFLNVLFEKEIMKLPIFKKDIEELEIYKTLDLDCSKLSNKYNCNNFL